MLSVARAKDYQEAADLIASHLFANGTAIFTRDGDAAREFAHQVEVGMVGINVPIPVPMAFHSLAAGSSRCLATTTCTAPKACASTPGSRPSPHAGPPASAPVRTSSCRPCADGEFRHG